MTADTYKFDGGPVLKVSGDGPARRHFAAEYREARTDVPLSPNTDISFVPHERSEGELKNGWVSGGHKTMHWRTRPGDPDSAVIRADIEMMGWPRGFGLSLVQGYFVEPMLSVSAARAGAVLLPAAAIEINGRALVVIGLSGSGKTSLSMHAMAAGLTVLGDDQVLLTPAGNCGPFPRRLRLYPDLRSRVPLAWERLPRGARAQLQARRLLRLASRGWLSPSFALDRDRIGRDGLPDPKPVGGIVMLIRAGSPGRARETNATIGEAIDYGIKALHEQRLHLAKTGDAWAACLRETERMEAGLLGQAFACAPVLRVIVPTPFPGGQLLELASSLGLLGVASRPEERASS
jgi:hypothetical protein